MTSRSRNPLTVLLLVALLFVATASGAPASDASRTKLGNGVTVISKPSSWNRIVAIAVAVEAGSKYDPPGLGGLAELTGQLLLEGTEEMGAMELAELADRHGIEMDTYTTQDFAGFHMACIDENIDAALEIVAAMLTRPALEEARFLRVQESQLERIERDNDDADARNRAQLFELLFGKHPYAHPIYGTAKSVQSMTPSHVRKFYDSRYAAENTVISIVGSFDEDAALTALEELLSDYREKGARESEPAGLRRGSASTSEIYMDIPRSSVLVGYLGPPAEHKDYAATRVAAAFLCGGERSLVSTLAAQDGIEEPVSSEAYVYTLLQTSALVVDCRGAEVEETVSAVQAAVDKLRSEPLGEEELRVARNSIKGTIAIRGQTNLARALRLSIDYLTTGRVDAMDTFLEQVARVSRDDVLRAAREYLTDPVIAIVRAGRSAAESRPVRRGI